MKNKRAVHPLDEHIGVRMRRARTHKGYSLEQVAEWLDISKQQVSRLEHGKSRLSVVQLYQISRGVDLPLSWFFEGFEDDTDEVKWVSNMVGEDRSQWTAASEEDRVRKMIALWGMVESRKVQRQIIGLLEAVTEM